MNALNADEIYQASRASVADGQKASDRSWRLDNGLSTRVFNALRRAGYASSLEGVDAEKLKADILNGKIWRARNVGQKTVRRLCEWLAAQDLKPTERLYRVAYQFDWEYDPAYPEHTFYIAAESFAHAETVAGNYLNDRTCDEFGHDLLPWFIHRLEYVSAAVFPLPSAAKQATLVIPPGVEMTYDDEADE